MKTLVESAKAAKAASLELARLTTEAKNAALRAMARALMEKSPEILAANEADMQRGREGGMPESLLDRLMLNEARIAGMAEGIRQGGESVVNTLLLPNAHPQLIPAISMTTQPPAGGAVGVLEFYSIASAITAADVAAKAANVTLIEVRIGYAIGGKGYVTLTGDVGAVRAAVAAAEREAELLVGTTVIPRPSPKLFQSLL